MHLHRALLALPLSHPSTLTPPSGSHQEHLVLSQGASVTPQFANGNGDYHYPPHVVLSKEKWEALEQRLELAMSKGNHHHEVTSGDVGQQQAFYQLDHPRPSMRRLLEDSASQVCDSLASGVLTVAKICDYAIRYPSGASIRKCKHRMEMPDDCASKAKYDYPCSKGLCKGWTCIPGTSMQDVSYPCGIDVDYRELQACDSNRMRDVARKGQASCSCISKVTEFLDGSNGKLSQLDTASEAGSRALQAHAQSVACLLNNGFSVQSNREAALGYLQSTSDTSYIALPEIDLDMYVDLIQRLAICGVTGECDSLVTLFTDYLKDSSQAIQDGMQKVIGEWMEPLQNNLLTMTKKILDAISSSDIEEAAACVAESVSIPAAEKLTHTVESLKSNLQTSEEITELQEALEAVSIAVSSLLAAVNSMTSAFSGDYAELVTSAAKNGGNIADILEAVLPTNELDKVVSLASNVNKLANDIGSGLGDSISDIRSLDEENLSCLQSGPIAEAFFAVKMLREDPKILRLRKIQVDAGIQSYNRWSDVSLDLPCTRTGKKCFSLSGQSSCVNYPEIYACRYGKRIPFPNEHIPYLRLRFS